MRPPCRLLPLMFALPLAACLDNEEEIEVRADGSVHVRVAARGPAEDMASGYPVPLAAPWSPASPDAQLWLETVGPDSGSEPVRGKVARGEWTRAADDPERDVELAAEATFRDVAEIPTYLAASGDPYRDAFLARDAALSIERRGTRTVYTFERRYLSRERRNASLDETARAGLPEALAEKLDAGGPFTSEERRQVCAAYGTAMAVDSARTARAAMESVYTDGDASLSLALFERTVERAVAEVKRIASVERLLTAWVETERRAKEQESGGVARGDNPLEILEAELRDSLRALLAELEHEGLDRETLNAVLFRLEWLFTSIDHTEDLGDEGFEVRVTMPGTVVSSNFGLVRGSSVTFNFDGSDLADGDVVLRVVSVLE